MKVFLDDERPAPVGWVRVCWHDEVIGLLKAGTVTELSLDHDLGDDTRGTGYSVLEWIENRLLFMAGAADHSSAYGESICKVEDGSSGCIDISPQGKPSQFFTGVRGGTVVAIPCTTEQCFARECSTVSKLPQKLEQFRNDSRYSGQLPQHLSTSTCNAQRTMSQFARGRLRQGSLCARCAARSDL